MDFPSTIDKLCAYFVWLSHSVGWNKRRQDVKLVFFTLVIPTNNNQFIENLVVIGGISGLKQASSGCQVDGSPQNMLVHAYEWSELNWKSADVVFWTLQTS